LIVSLRGMAINQGENTVNTGNGVKIGVIGGAGWLGGAIAEALLDANIVDAPNLAMSYRSQKPERIPDAFWTKDNQALVDRSDFVIVSVRPEDWHQLKADAKGKLVISVMAGIRLASLCEHHNCARVVRTLPNAAAEMRKSYTPWIATGDVDEEDRAIVRKILSACGLEDEVRTEAELDYLTGLSGSGPAFPALLAQTMMNDAVAFGLDARIARRAVNTVFVGAGRLLERRVLPSCLRLVEVGRGVYKSGSHFRSVVGPQSESIYTGVAV
jgi:pyrroline-5-carboxylate reductase